MPYILSFVALLLLAFAGNRWIRNQLAKEDPVERRKGLIQAVLILVFVIIVLLTVTGRLHWIGALIAASIPAVKYLLSIALRLLPFFGSRFKPSPTQSNPAPADSGTMTHADALRVLGLSEGADKDAIIEAHRQLMQKVHPDRGGSDDLAARINQAKDILLG